MIDYLVEMMPTIMFTMGMVVGGLYTIWLLCYHFKFRRDK